MCAMQGSYVPPAVADYGDLGEVTAGAYPLLGAAAAQDMSFSAPVTPQPGGGELPFTGLAAGAVAGVGAALAGAGAALRRAARRRPRA
jgi:hypothetical protein